MTTRSESGLPTESAAAADDSARPTRVAVVLSGWPRVSEVFALNELVALHRAGMLAAVFALKSGEAASPHPAAAEIDGLVERVPAGETWEQAAHIARRLGGMGVAGVHGYFAHDPAAVAAETASLLGLPYGFSVHALDARKVDRAVLGQRAAKAAVVIACNRDAAAEVASTGTAPLLVPHGVDLAAFAATPPRLRATISAIDGGSPAARAAQPADGPVVLLAVGRLVEKKGFAVLLDALSEVDRPFVLRLVGDGPLRDDLTGSIHRHGLEDRVQLVGRVTHATLPILYADADIVVVPSVVDSRGDRDGLPNVVLEAMASQRAVVASDVAAISTAVHDGVTGVLVPSGDPAALAQALQALIDDPAERSRLGGAARATVESRFDLGRCATEFCRTVERAYA